MWVLLKPEYVVIFLKCELRWRLVFFILHIPDLERKYNIVLDVQWNHSVLFKIYIYINASVLHIWKRNITKKTQKDRILSDLNHSRAYRTDLTTSCEKSQILD